MLRPLNFSPLLGLAACLYTGAAIAHPHIIATAQIHLSQAGEKPAVLKTSWTYDPGFSSFTMLQANMLGGGVSEEKLARIATDQMQALALYHFFTKLTIDGDAAPVTAAADYRMTKTAEGALRLEFSLALPPSAVRAKSMRIQLFDPEFFAYFSLAAQDGVIVDPGFGTCQVRVNTPQRVDLKNTRSVPKAFWAALGGSQEAGKQFKTVVDVTCS